MVSPWCNNGTLTRYLEMNPEANRFALVSEELGYIHSTLLREG